MSDPEIWVDGDSDSFAVPRETWGPDVFDSYTPEAKASRLNALKSGALYLDGEKISEAAAAKLRDRILGTYADDSPVFDPTNESPTRPYIPGLWNHGRKPALSGPKGVGKTTFVCQLAAALMIEGRRFLDRFEPVTFGEWEWERDVWLMNSESAPNAVHEELLRAGLEFGYRNGVPCYHDPADKGWLHNGVLIVEHLPSHSGGAVSFNLADPAKRRWWEERLIRFTENRAAPLTVIADGVTAMVGSNTSSYGAWTSGFRLLLQEAGIPNGLGILHSAMGAVGPGRAPTPMQGVESMGEWDGIWYYAAGSFPVFADTRRDFYTAPRLGDPIVLSHRVSMDDEGMLRLVPREGERPERASGVASVEDGNPARSAVLEALSAAGEAGLSGVELTGRGRDGIEKRQARDRLVKDGLIFSINEGRGSRWFLSEFR